MRSTLVSLLIGLIVIAVLGVGGYFVLKKFRVGADVATQEKSADLNKDEKVDGLDLNMLLKAISEKSENPNFDLNSDGKVDSTDADLLARQWQQ